MAAGQWEPKYPEFAEPAKAEGRSGPITDPESFADGSDGRVEWVKAPGTSHLWGFRLYAASEHRFLRRFFGGKSILYVRFNPSAGKTGYTEYAYEFQDEREARRVFELMRAAPQPGKVVHKELTGGGVPYYPTHK